MAEAGGAEALEALVAFGRRLRARGLVVGTDRILTFCRAVAVLGIGDREDLYWAGRLAIVSRPEDLAVYDEVFDAWHRGASGMGLAAPDPDRVRRELAGGPGGAAVGAPTGEEPRPPGERAGDPAVARVVASAIEVLRERSFADLTDEERARVDRLIRRLRVRVPLERSRRTRPSARGPKWDLRATLRRSLRTRGEPLERVWRIRRARARPLVLLLDVSGSMGPYARALVQFGFAAMATGRRVEVFCFGTRLTRVTPLLRRRDPDRALAEIGRAVADWEGGTRIGASLKELLEGWSQRAALRGAVVVLCSDGLERGDPALLRAQMARLRRLAHRVVWANPLKGSPRYEPLARGMAAALPSVDVFLSGHDLASLEELAEAVGR
jgi:uncharacterized protein with von Willebrand factor type A (vWA) domain